MSTHKECGEPVVWVKRDDDPNRWAPPLEYAGHGLIITDGPHGDKISVYVSIYREHNCDPDKVLAWLEYKEKLAAIEERTGGMHISFKPAWEIARDRDREETWKLAKKVECDTCGAKKRQYCTSLAKGPKFGMEILNPHQERLLKYDKLNETTDHASQDGGYN